MTDQGSDDELLRGIESDSSFSLMPTPNHGNQSENKMVLSGQKPGTTIPFNMPAVFLNRIVERKWLFINILQ